MGSPTKRYPLGSPPKSNDANANANNPPAPSLCASQLRHHHWAAPDVQLSVSVTEGFLCLLPHSSRIHLFSVSWLAPQRARPPFVDRFIRRRPPSSSVHARARAHALNTHGGSRAPEKMAGRQLLLLGLLLGVVGIAGTGASLTHEIRDT